jgi:6-phosphofructokinase 1
LVCGEGPDLVYLPERVFDMDEFLSSVKAALEKHPNVVVAVSEGAHFADGRYVGESTQSGSVDAFGHKYLAGTGKALEIAVKSEIGCKVRSVELNLPQRCAAHIASATDIKESVKVGRSAVAAACKGASEVMMCMQRKSDKKGAYSISVSPSSIYDIANKIKYVPDSFINKEGNNVTDECLEYLLPLICGEVKVKYKSGLPVHCIIK